jgi:hypothetical protein
MANVNSVVWQLHKYIGDFADKVSVAYSRDIGLRMNFVPREIERAKRFSEKLRKRSVDMDYSEKSGDGIWNIKLTPSKQRKRRNLDKKILSLLEHIMN